MPLGFEVYYMHTSKHEEDKRLKMCPGVVPGIFVCYKLYPGEAWRDEYLVIDFKPFQETRAGFHSADHYTKGVSSRIA